jgi:hypothetical protein
MEVWQERCVVQPRVAETAVRPGVEDGGGGIDSAHCVKFGVAVDEAGQVFGGCQHYFGGERQDIHDHDDVAAIGGMPCTDRSPLDMDLCP